MEEPVILWTHPGEYVLQVVGPDNTMRQVRQKFQTQEQLIGLVDRWRNQNVGHVLVATIYKGK